MKNEAQSEPSTFSRIGNELQNGNNKISWNTCDLGYLSDREIERDDRVLNQILRLIFWYV